MAAGELIADERRSEIVWLLTHRNDHLPLPVRHVAETSGFVNGRRPRSCPDCLANGRTMVGCETCGGSGVVEPSRIGLVSAPDELPDDGTTRDPYANNESVGYDRTRHDSIVSRDRQIEVLKQQTRPPRSELELLEEANRRGYAWEEERRTMYRRYDFAAIDRALDALRASDTDAAHAINAVYVDGWLPLVGLITPLVEQHCDRGIQSLSRILPNQLRSGATIHHAEARQHRRRTTSDTICTITSPAVAEAQPAMGTGNNAAAYPHKDAA